jgi:hypothetical protein
VSGVIFQQEEFSQELANEILPFSDAHFREVCGLDGGQVQVNVSEYEQLASLGKLRIFTARNGKLIGYAVFVVHPHPHYSVLAATQTLLYLRPEERQGWRGLMFLRSCDEKLEAEGVRIIFQYSSEEKNIGPVLGKLGYKHIENVWARRLK